MLPLPGDDTPAGQEVAVRPDPLVDLSTQRNTTALRCALLNLPIKYREVIVLCDLQELSYADAARALKCAVGTVRSRLHRGRALLARRLCDQEDGQLFRLPATRSVI
jgi:RNA polymerase sigma-70 factor (ECF subfamily)